MIKLIPYQTTWPQEFALEAKKIQQALGKNCIAIHHIGSTSVPELSAKPIIDILPVVADLKAVDACNGNMQQLGYEVKGEWGFMLRRFFMKENAFNVHVFEENNPDIERHLKFRDWMRSHPEDRDRYEALKLALAAKFSNDRTAYTIGKDEFIANIDEQAGWKGIRIVKALTDNEWNAVTSFRKVYYNKNHLHDPFIELLTDSNHTHLVVLKKTEIIGYAHVQLCPDNQAIIHHVYINENYREFSYDKELMSFIEKWLYTRDFKINK